MSDTAIATVADTFYMTIAYEEAQKSRDPSTQNGAVLVKDHLIIGMGANNFACGVGEWPERWERPDKYMYVEHAERNSIFSAAFRGNSTAGATLYCPWLACADCARAIIQAGIKDCVAHKPSTVDDDASRRWTGSVEVGLNMLKEARVEVRYLTNDIGSAIRRDGRVVSV